MASGDLSVGRCRDHSANVDQAAKMDRTVFNGRSVQPPDAGLTCLRYAVMEGFLDQQYVQILALMVVDEGSHPRPQFQDIQL